MKILERELVYVDVDSLKFDPDNPNVMTEEQMKALEESMNRFGYLTPIIVDQNNMIADGEHRALIYKKRGLKQIPAFRVEFASDTERRLLRQVMNKLHGKHDIQKDIVELEILMKNHSQELLTFLAVKKEDIETMKQLAKKASDEDWKAMLASTTQNKEDLPKLKQLKLYLSEEDFELVDSALRELDANKNVAIVELVEQWLKFREGEEEANPKE